MIGNIGIDSNAKILHVLSMHGTVSEMLTFL